MGLINNVRNLEKRLRLMLLATVLLLAPGIGQFVTIRSLNTTGQDSALGLVFAIAGIFFVPTSFILTAVIMASVRHEWRRHERLMILGVLNLALIINLVWFFVTKCSWASVFGLTLKVCGA